MTNIRNATPVTAHDRVSEVLARDESLVAVFERTAPHFSKLRNRTMRRVMARLVTVGQAARTANVPVEQLVRDLNDALGLAAPTVVPGSGPVAPAPTPPAASLATPAVRAYPATEATLVHPATARVVELDVREDLRSGREPFSQIMAAVASLGDDAVLHLRAIFEPVPLFTVLGKRGFTHESRAHAPDDWSVWFWRVPAVSVASGGGVATERGAPAGGGPSPDVADPSVQDEDGATTTLLDVRGLEPPEPLMRTMAALETLPDGHVLMHVNSRVPQLLFPLLAERGFACEVDESQTDRVLVRIWRAPARPSDA